MMQSSPTTRVYAPHSRPTFGGRHRECQATQSLQTTFPTDSHWQSGPGTGRSEPFLRRRLFPVIRRFTPFQIGGNDVQRDLQFLSSVAFGVEDAAHLNPTEDEGTHLSAFA